MICLMRIVAIDDSKVPSSGRKPLVERKAMSTKKRRAASSVVGPTKHMLAESNCPPRLKTVFSVPRLNSMQTRAEFDTTVSPRCVAASRRARTKQVVLPSK